MIFPTVQAPATTQADPSALGQIFGRLDGGRTIYLVFS